MIVAPWLAEVRAVIVGAVADPEATRRTTELYAPVPFALTVAIWKSYDEPEFRPVTLKKVPVVPVFAVVVVQGVVPVTRYWIAYPPIGRPLAFVGAVQFKRTEPLPEFVAVTPVGAPARPVGVTVTVREVPATEPAPIAVTRKVIGTPFVRPDAIVQLKVPLAGMLARVVQFTPSVDDDTE